MLDIIRSIPATALGAALAVSVVSAQEVIYTVDSLAPVGEFGFDVESVGDVDLDGTEDWIVGSPWQFILGVSRGAVQVRSGRAGQLIFEALGALPDAALGFSVGGVGDVNGDGVPDVIAGAVYDKDAQGVDVGSATVLSGFGGTILKRFEGAHSGGIFGRAVCGAGDVNNDGVPDIAIGAPWASAASGTAQVFSGADWSELYTFKGVPGEELGYSLDAAGDADLDGWADLVVGCRGADSMGIDSGQVRAYSGLTGAILWRAHGGAGDMLGLACAGAGDVDGDGAPDVIAGSQSGNYARIYSGPDGALVRELPGQSLPCVPAGCPEYFGRAVDGLGDIDGDGHSELLVGAPSSGLGLLQPGYLRVFDGADGSVLFEARGTSPGDQYGYSLCGTGDLDGDALPDILVGAKNEGPGRIYAISGRPLSLFGDVPQVSLSAGGAQLLDLVAGPHFPNLPYLLLGSATGTSPGWPLDGRILPLVPDVYLLYTLQAPNAPPLVSSLGILDSAGRSTAAFALPAGQSPAHAGLSLYHAFAVLGVSTGSVQVLFISNPVAVTLAP